jgi:asparagine synthase (glutamine-hydrolysing)
MCGICGIYNQAGVQREDLHSMLGSIAHRGPDDEGVYINDRLGLGSRRLSIIDLPGGHQPISNEDETIWIAYNGEIYNYRQLRDELEQKGHRFRTRSDTEVIVHLYEDYGERCVEKLRGMFAFAIWDGNQSKLVLARDRIGQKPLYYAQEGDSMLFASEVKSILAASRQAPEMDYESLHNYLSLRFIPPPRTMVRNINKLPPGHLLVYQSGKVRITRYWNLNFNNKLELSEEELLKQLHEQLIETIDSHLVSDVPVGAYLSGGLDSSTIAAIMAKDLDVKFKTFAVGVKEQDFNELPYARQVADHLGTQHIEQCVEANLIQLLPKVIWHLDEPSDPIAACMFYAAELASRHVKVVLSGDGGDELFAGYDRYFGFDYINLYSRIPSFLRQRMIGPVFDHLPDSFTYKSLTQKLRWVHSLSAMNGKGEQYAEATCFFRFSHHDKHALFGDGLWEQVGKINSSSVITEQFYSANANDPVDRMLYADFMTRLPEHSLMLTDRMTMAHGLEARAPFLDHKLIEFLAAFPSQLKIKNRTTKYALRKLVGGYLPEEIVRRPKQGFMFPIAYWFRNELYPFVKDFLLNSHFVRTGLFQEKAILRLLEDHRENRVDNHVRLWMLLNLEIWRQLYIEQASLDQVGAMMKAPVKL